VKLWILLLTGALAVAAVGVVRQVTVTPSYRAAASLYSADPTGARHVLASSDFQRGALAALAPPAGTSSDAHGGRVQIVPIARGGWVDVAVTAPDAEWAAAAANALASTYARLEADAARADAEGRLRQLDAEVAAAQPVVDELERQLNRKRHDAASGGMAAARLPGLTTSLGQAHSNRVGLEEFVERASDPVSTTVVLRDQTAQLYERRVLDLERQRVVVASRYGEHHPALEQLEQALEAARQDRDWVAAKLVGVVEQDYRTALAREQLLSEEHAAATRQAVSGARARHEAEVLERSLDAQRALVQTLHDNARELRELSERAKPSRVVEVAVRGVPMRDPVPYWRVSALLTLAAMIAGLFATRQHASRQHASRQRASGPRVSRSHAIGADLRPHRRRSSSDSAKPPARRHAA
jgi:uncharacterized protein involved in exopolysaccharide biosynthesis